MTTPVPGGRLDGMQRAADAAAAPDFFPAEPPAGMQAVPVRVETPAGAVPRTLWLPASGVQMLVPQDPRRQRFIVLAVDGAIVLCGSKELAQDAGNQATTSAGPPPQGFYLPAGTPIPLYSGAVWWVANASSSTGTRVSVAIEKHEAAPEW